MRIHRGKGSWRWGWIIGVLAALCACVPADKTIRPSGDRASKAPADPLAAVTPAMQANEEEKTLLTQANQFRREQGLAVLRPERRLMGIARRHAENMARKDRFGDTDKNGHVLDGMDPGDRVQVGGYAFARVAENVGWQIGRPDPVIAMVEGWKHSPGHRKNLLIAEMVETGVGAAQGRSGRWYFVQLFAKPFESTRRVSNKMVSELTP